MNTPTLREELIEAAAQAFNGTYKDIESGKLVQADWRGDLDDMERALDAILDKLEEHADEWFDAWTHWTDPVDGGSKFIGLIAALRGVVE